MDKHNPEKQLLILFKLAYLKSTIHIPNSVILKKTLGIKT